LTALNTPKDWVDSLDALYSAVGKPALWVLALDALCEVLQADSALLFTPCPQLLEMPHHWSSRYNPNTIPDYLKNFLLEDPYNASATAADNFKMGNVMIGDDIVNPSYLQTTRFFKEFSLKYNQGHLLASIPFDGYGAHGMPIVVLSFYRPITHERFTQTEVGILKKLLPHLQRAWLLHSQTLEYQARNNAFESALNQLKQGVILLSKKGEMRFANHVAEQFLSNVYLSELSLKQVGTIGLPKSIADVCNLASHKKILCKKVVLKQQAPWYLLVAPLRRLSSVAIPSALKSHGQDDIVVWVTQSRQSVKPNVDVMADLFALTKTECKILQMLLGSQTPQEIAEGMQVKITTVRSHVAAILAKTGTKRQQELICLAATFEFID
jgi:DNA-binding CsgD family transcriptional regulator